MAKGKACILSFLSSVCCKLFDAFFRIAVIQQGTSHIRRLWLMYPL
jgi:hypothetical protein